MTTKTVIVPNISCSHCVHTIETEVGDLEGVQSVKAQETTKQVTVDFDAPATWDSIKELLVEIDYPPAEG
ncbi:MAG: copper ion binding protein [Caldilineaceae bacterium]|nr:copper ion binding protein [Caldilineaceae bacterium]